MTKSGAPFVSGWVAGPMSRGGGVLSRRARPQGRAGIASRKLSSIEINGTFYGSQKPESFAKWHDETPDGFAFALKGLRYATNRRVLGEAGETIERFFKSGVMELKDKLVRSTGSSCRRRSWTSRTSRASRGCCRGPWMGARSATHSRSGTPASARPNSSP